MRVLKLFVGEFSFRIHYLGKLQQVQKVPIHLNNQQECIPVVCVQNTLSWKTETSTKSTNPSE